MMRLSHSYCYLVRNCAQWADWHGHVKQLSIKTHNTNAPKLYKKIRLKRKKRERENPCVSFCVPTQCVCVHLVYLFVCMVVGVDVVVKLLVSQILLIAELTVKPRVPLLLPRDKGEKEIRQGERSEVLIWKYHFLYCVCVVTLGVIAPLTRHMALYSQFMMIFY